MYNNAPRLPVEKQQAQVNADCGLTKDEHDEAHTNNKLPVQHSML
jgi:hypothetical protein